MNLMDANQFEIFLKEFIHLDHKDIFKKEDYVGKRCTEDAFDKAIAAGLINKYTPSFYFIGSNHIDIIYYAVEKYLPAERVFICDFSACLEQDLYNYHPEVLQLGYTGPDVNVDECFAELFELKKFSPEEAKGFEQKHFGGVSLSIFTPERCLFYLCGKGRPRGEAFYKAINTFIQSIPADYNFDVIMSLGKELGRNIEADIIVACLLTAREARNIY